MLLPVSLRVRLGIRIMSTFFSDGFYDNSQRLRVRRTLWLATADVPDIEFERQEEALSAAVTYILNYTNREALTPALEPIAARMAADLLSPPPCGISSISEGEVSLSFDLSSVISRYSRELQPYRRLARV